MNASEVMVSRAREVDPSGKSLLSRAQKFSEEHPHKSRLSGVHLKAQG